MLKGPVKPCKHLPLFANIYNLFSGGIVVDKVIDYQFRNPGFDLMLLRPFGCDFF